MITVIAGVNGAGKSSVAGKHIRASEGNYFNPDEAARKLMAKDSSLSQFEANAKAWQSGYERLVTAIDTHSHYAFETTLGGKSICKQLYRASDLGQELRVFYIGLASVDLHIERVAARVDQGGHDIPESKIRERCLSSLHNMLGLIPHCTTLRVFDNTRHEDEIGTLSRCLFSFENRRFILPPVADMPTWAKPLASVAIKYCISSK